MGGITHIYIPVSIYRLGLKGIAELSILALAASFGKAGLTMSNTSLAASLHIQRRNIIAAIHRLRKRGYLTEYGGRRSHRLIASPHVIALAEGDEKTPVQVSKRLTSGVEETHITKGTECELNTLSRRQVRFIAPSLEEVEQYVAQKQLRIDAASFHRYFEESGWVDSNGKKVRNWKQKAISWHSHNKERKDGVKRDGTIRNFGNLTSNYGSTFTNAAAVPVRDSRDASGAELQGKEGLHMVAEALPVMFGKREKKTPLAGASTIPSQEEVRDDKATARGASAGIPPRSDASGAACAETAAAGSPSRHIPLGACGDGQDPRDGSYGTPHSLQLRAGLQESNVQRPAAGSAGELAQAWRPR